MKKLHLAFLCMVCFFGSTGFSQKVYTKADVFTQKDMIWYGLDFTYAKFIGEPSIHGNFYKEPAYVVKYFFKDWNMIPMTEAEKYDIRGQFDKEYVYYDLDTVMERNKRYKSDSLISFRGVYNINTEQIPAIIQSYGGVAKEGIGIVYIVESFDHVKDVASIYCVVFDVASKTILFQENIKAKPSGGSVKTFWAGAIREALEKNHKVYRRWKKETIVKEK